MKQKILLTLSFSYLVLIILILAIGLNFQGRNNSLMIGVTPDSTSGQPEEEVFQTSKTKIHTSGTQTITEIFLSPTFETTESQAITETLIPTQLETPTPITPTPTSPSYPISDQGTSTPTSTQESYPVDEASTPATFTPTVMPSQTSTTQDGWGGEWIVFWEQLDGSYLSGLMTVKIENTELTASVSIGEENYSFEGVLNDGLVTTVGSWYALGESGYFYWRSVSSDQFVGNLDRQFGFCGSRGDASIPEPCIKIPTDY